MAGFTYRFLPFCIQNNPYNLNYKYLLIVMNQNTKENQDQQIEQLNCPVCMCLFSTPVTIQCGHTFCRYCLMNSVKTKNSCPICRKNLVNLPQRPKQDETVFSIVSEIKKKNNKKIKIMKETTEQFIGRKIDALLLIDIRTSDVLLPSTKVTATFQLQSPTLLNKLERFIARQQAPFNKYGVISKICSLNQLRFNVYECTIQGKYFCKIQEEWVQRNQEYQDQFFYRSCNVQEISQFSDEDATIYNKFFTLFSQIKDPSALQYVYKLIDPHVFMDKNDPIAIFYSIIRILNIPNSTKYDIAIQFSEEKRKNFLQGHLNSIKYDVSKNFGTFMLTEGNKRIKEGSIIIFLLIIGFLVLFHGMGEL